MTERSPELQEREAKFRALREKHPVRTAEPGVAERQGRDSLKRFVELTGEVARNYEPSSYLKAAPKK